MYQEYLVDLNLKQIYRGFIFQRKRKEKGNDRINESDQHGAGPARIGGWRASGGAGLGWPVGSPGARWITCTHMHAVYDGDASQYSSAAATRAAEVKRRLTSGGLWVKEAS
jgi:hypothetical protein